MEVEFCTIFSLPKMANLQSMHRSLALAGFEG